MVGIGVSTSAQTLVNDWVSSSYQACDPVSASNTIKLTGVTITQAPGCPPEDMTTDIDQATSVDATCLLGSLQTTAAQQATNISSSIDPGFLDFDVTSDFNTTYNNLQQYTTQACKDVSSTNMVDWDQVKLETCGFKITQNATANTSCQIQQVQDQMAKIATNITQEESGFSLGGIIAIVAGVIGILIVIGIVLVAIFVFGKKNKNGDSTTDNAKPTTDNAKPTATPDASSDGNAGDTPELTGGQSKSNNNKIPLYSIIIIGLLLLIAIFVSFSTTKNKCFTESDIYNFNKKIQEAREIAHINSPYQNDISSQQENYNNYY